MNISVIVLAVVLVLIAVRKIGPYRLHIWQIMLGGAIAVLVTGSIPMPDAIRSVNIDVMLFLFGMFVLGQALEDSGYLGHLAYKMFKRARSLDTLLLFVILGSGIGSALLMNDTLAIIGTPVVLLLSRKHRFKPGILLLALAFSVTIGSVMSPIGNPQNLLIALDGGIENPFITFIRYLFVPTMINLVVLYLMLKLVYREHFHTDRLDHSQEPIRDHRLALLSKLSLFLVMALILLKIILVFFGMDFNIVYIALGGAIPILIYRIFAKNFHIMRRIDWFTLVFFASMFVLMESVWLSGFFQGMIERAAIDMASVPIIMAVSLVVSQLISNVPLVALYLPILSHSGITHQGLMALAAGSTIAGSMFIMGAASNIIIIQNAEKKSGQTIGFWEFSRIGIPLTIVCSLVYLAFLSIL